jgi:hypothetical protein
MENPAYQKCEKTLTIGVMVTMKWKGFLLVIGFFLLAGCSTIEPRIDPTPTNSVASQATATTRTVTVTITALSPTDTETPSPEPTATDTAVPTLTDTPEPTVEAAASSAGDSAIVADHTVLNQFEQIPDEFIEAAASMRLLFRGSSIAHNINMGLDCLEGNFNGRRPNYCSDFTNVKYDRANWVFPVRGNPGWIQKVDDFIELVNQNAEQYEVFIFLVDYADGIDNATYPKISDPDNFQTRFVEPLEALEEQHPDKIIVWTTMSMARTGFDNATQFNRMLREYAAQNGKILFDLGDIESHSPEGEAQFDEQGREVLYAGYTDEARAGHLNEAGRERIARALWWFMARISGWEG